MTQLLLIRHARNDWVGKRLPGHTPGIHLNAEGHREAAGLAGRMAAHNLAAVYSSPLERAMETAQYLVGGRGLEIQPVPELVDTDTGDWTGRLIEELAQEPAWRGILAAPSLTRLPGGETLWEMQARVVGALEGIRGRHPEGAVAAVAHADVIKAAVAHYLGLPLDLFQRIIVAPASVSVLEFSPYGARLVALNLTGELPPAPVTGEQQNGAAPREEG